MKKTIRFGLASYAAAAVALASASPAIAAGVDFTQPENNADVGADFMLTGTYQPGCGQQALPVTAEDSKGNRGLLDSSGFTRTGDSFRYAIDFSKPLEDTQDYIQRGPVILEMGGSTNCPLARLAVNYGASASPAASTTPTPSATPTPTPTPSVIPRPVPSGPTTDWLENLDPALVLLIGAVAGGAVTGLAELSWIRYRKKRRKS